VHGRNAPHGRNPAEIADAHLSAVDESHLQELAAATGLRYLRLTEPRQFARSLTDRRLSTWRAALTDLRPWLALPAMLLILAYFLPPAFSVFVRNLAFWKRIDK
jgi:mxaL protein